MWKSIMGEKYYLHFKTGASKKHQVHYSGPIFIETWKYF